MQQIWKFPLLSAAEAIKIPRGARILDVQLQNDRPCLWALVTPAAELVARAIHICGTGSDLLGGTENYLATFQQGPFVWHVFDGGEI